MSRFIPLSIPNFAGNEKKYITDAIEQGWVSTGGAYITSLEKNLGRYMNCHKLAACQSGTAALHLALLECGVMPGDMVIVPTLTFIAAVNPVRYQFAEPVFMDCDDSLCMDPVKLEEFCRKECRVDGDKLIHNQSGKHIKAVIVVHVFGNMADMESIMDTARRYNLKVVEDATEALGTRYTEGKYAGRYAGTIGDFGAYSFNGNKIITTGGGGAVMAKSEQMVDHIRFLSTQAKTDAHYYIHDEIGYNYRMTNLQAALGVAQLEELPDFIETEHRLYSKYKELFENYEYGKLLAFREGVYSNKWFFSLEIPMEKIACDMRTIITGLEAEGIQTRAIWGLIHEQKPYREALAYKIEKAKFYSERILNIPCSTQLTEDDVCYAAGKIKDAIEKMAV